MLKTMSTVFVVVFSTLLVNVFGTNTGSAQPGLCIVEVPTIDLISENERHLQEPSGNGSRPDYTRLELCCIGYARDRYNVCAPFCEGGCENGHCVAPNQCRCPQNYVKRRGRCAPTCPVGCLNGECRGTRCICNHGYEPDEMRKSCSPICLEGCGPGGDCTAPGVCTCRNGAISNPATGQCEYQCRGGCIGGTCVAPDSCRCDPGYSKQGNACVPQCPLGCINGECSAPNRCTCRPGWVLDASGTECRQSYGAPVGVKSGGGYPSAPSRGQCDLPCYNGECTGRNQCTCRSGYVLDPTGGSWNRCVAYCQGGCENGTCSSPNFCICNPGFVKESRGSNRCVRRY